MTRFRKNNFRKKKQKNIEKKPYDKYPVGSKEWVENKEREINKKLYLESAGVKANSTE